MTKQRYKEQKTNNINNDKFFFQKILSPEQTVAIINAEVKDYETFAIKLALFTFMRPGEVLGLYWSDFNFIRHEVFIHETLREREADKGKEYYIAKYTKTRADRYVRISSETEKMVKNWYAACGSPDSESPVFAVSGKYVTPDQIALKLKELAGETGRRITRTTVSHAVIIEDNSLGIDKARQNCGHENTYRTREHYSAIRQEDLEELIWS